MSEWDYKKGNIYKYIAEKHGLPKLARTFGEVLGKTVQDVWDGREHLHIEFVDGVILKLSSSRGWDDLETPTIVREIDWEFIRDYCEHKSGEYKGSKNPIYIEMDKLMRKFDEDEKIRRDEATYQRLKEKLGKT